MTAGNGKTSTLAVHKLTRLNWLNIHYENNGYGRYGLGFVRALLRVGIDVRLQCLDALDLPAWAWQTVGLDFANPTFTLTTCNRLKAVPGRQWAVSMYETTSVPEQWVKKLNQYCERLIVPCHQNLEAFQDSGVTIPIHVVNGGCNTTEFDILPTRQNRPYTFLAFGDGLSRKGLDITLQAFSKGFTAGEDVRLIIKSRPKSDFGLRINEADTPDHRISVWADNADSLADVFAQADCFVYPTRGEGWGLPPREAALCGLPVITTRWAGTAVNIDQWALPINEYELERSNLLGGYWAKPSLDETIALMRWCYEHPTDARQKGLEAAQWLNTNQTWDKAAVRLLSVAEVALNPVKPVPTPSDTLQSFEAVFNA